MEYVELKRLYDDLATSWEEFKRRRPGRMESDRGGQRVLRLSAEGRPGPGSARSQSARDGRRHGGRLFGAERLQQ
jgi:hypothetical protein